MIHTHAFMCVFHAMIYTVLAILCQCPKSSSHSCQHKYKKQHNSLWYVFMLFNNAMKCLDYIVLVLRCVYKYKLKVSFEYFVYKPRFMCGQRLGFAFVCEWRLGCGFVCAWTSVVQDINSRVQVQVYISNALSCSHLNISFTWSSHWGTCE